MNSNNFIYRVQRACGDLDGGETYSCDTPLQGGSDPNVTLINHAQLLSWGVGSTPNLITSLTLANGASGFRFQGFGKSVSPQQEVVQAPSGQNLTKHQCGIFIFSRSQATKNRIQNMLVGKFIAIVQANTKDENAFEVYGLRNGLELVPGVINQLNENNGAYQLTLATKDGLQESKLPQTFFNTDFATTLATVQGLWYQPAVLNLTDLAISTAGGDAIEVVGLNFYGSGSSGDVSSVKWVNQNTLAETNQTGVTVDSNTKLHFSSVALTAGTYKLKVTTSKGVAYSNVNIVVS